MSLNQLLLDEIKPYMNIRVNNIMVDGDIKGSGGTDTFPELYDNSNPPIIEYDPAKNIQIKNDPLDSNTLMFAITDNADTQDYLRVESNRFTAINSSVSADNSIAIGENNDIDASSEGIVFGINNSLTAGNGSIFDTTNLQLNNSTFQGNIFKGNDGIMLVGSNNLSDPLPNNGIGTCDHVIFQTTKAFGSGATFQDIFSLQTISNTVYLLDFDIVIQQTNGALQRSVVKRRIYLDNDGSTPLSAIEDIFIKSDIGTLSPIPTIIYDTALTNFKLVSFGLAGKDLTYSISIFRMQYTYA